MSDLSRNIVRSVKEAYLMSACEHTLEKNNTVARNVENAYI